MPDYFKPNIVKNHHEAIRSFDILMKYFPEKVVTGTYIDKSLNYCTVPN